MAQRTAGADCPCPKLRVSRWNNVARSWTHDDIRPAAFLESRKNPFENSQVTLVRTSARTVRTCNFCRSNFTNVFQMPELWWSEFSRNGNGCFGCDTTRDENDKIASHTAWSRFLIKQLYEDVENKGIKNRWYHINMFTQWIASNNETVVLLFDAPRIKAPAAAAAAAVVVNGSQAAAATNNTTPTTNRFIDVIQLFEGPVMDRDPERGTRVSLLHEPDLLSDAFWIHARTLGEVAALQDDAVWTLRNYLRTLEKSRDLGEKPAPDYERLYELLRHAVHISETLDVAVRSAAAMVLQHQEHMADNDGNDDSVDDGNGSSSSSSSTKKAKTTHKTVSKRVRQRLLALEHVLDSLRARAASNKERLLNEIQLSFNAVSQFDSKVTLADSKAMKAIAFLTMAFLPATFICAIFSMSFFNYDAGSDEWNMSGKIWVYWAFALPVTLLTLLAGWAWLGWHNVNWKGWKSIFK